MSRAHSASTYLLWAVTCFIYLIAVKHVLGNVNRCLNVMVQLWHRQGSTVPRVLGMLTSAVFVQVGLVELVEGLGGEIAWKSLLPLWVCSYTIGEVPASPGVPHYTHPLHLLSQIVNVVEGAYATG